MAGFKRDVDIEIEDIDTDIDVDDDIDDEDEIDDSVKTGRGVKAPQSDKKKSSNQVIRKKNTNKSSDKQVFVVIGIVAVVIVVGLVMLSIGSSKKKKEQELMLMRQQQEEGYKSSSSSESNVKPGIPSFNGVGADENDEFLYDPTLITKDLNGNQVPTDYSVRDSNIVTDYINYKKYRAFTGNGLEFYWLEAEYKGQPYKVQVPYSVYSKLDYSGITVVDMEVLDLEDGGRMITYMSVRKDAKKLLEDN